MPNHINIASGFYPSGTAGAPGSPPDLAVLRMLMKVVTGYVVLWVLLSRIFPDSIVMPVLNLPHNDQGVPSSAVPENSVWEFEPYQELECCFEVPQQ